MSDAGLLYARIGRVTPSPWFDTRVDRRADTAGDAHGRPEQHQASASFSWPDAAQAGSARRWRAVFARMPRAAGPLLLLLAALWPHGLWLAQRLSDGSDEPWGLLALLTVLTLVVRSRHELVLPTRPALVASSTLAVIAACLTFVVPPIFAAAVAMLALAAFVTSALPRRPAAPLATLLLLALPVIASLQFYLGYPLRLATAHAAAPLLGLVGIDVEAAGAALLWRGQTILVDPPCAGIGMLWVGAWTAALMSYLHDATARRTFVNGCFAAAVVFTANVLRNALLFFPESGLTAQPAWLHPAIGLVAFAAALLPIIAFAARTSMPGPDAVHVAGGRAAFDRPFARRFGEARPGLRAAALWPRGRSPLHASARGFASVARIRTFFVGACLAAAVLPPLGDLLSASGAAGGEPAAAAGPRSASIEWPTHFRGQPLTQLPPTALEARFAARFPGAVGRFTDGEQLLIVRHLRRATRRLHPASDCFRAAGYAVAAARAVVDSQGVRWRCFVATRGAERLRVCERISERLDETDDSGWTDVSAWFWEAQFRRRASAWWAVTVVAPLESESDL